MDYETLKANQAKKLSNFPIFFAFSQNQFDSGIKKLGVTSNSELLSIGSGGYIKKADKENFKKMFDENTAEFNEAFKDDDFLYSALFYELCNHEYGYTYDHEPALRALNLTFEEVEKDARMLNLFIKACNAAKE